MNNGHDRGSSSRCFFPHSVAAVCLCVCEGGVWIVGVTDAWWGWWRVVGKGALQLLLPCRRRRRLENCIAAVLICEDGILLFFFIDY